MTNEEAIKLTKDMLKVKSDAYYDYIQNGGKTDVAEEVCLDVMQTAIEALEKQIPKKPVHDNDLYRCPNCGDTWNCNEYEMNYCWECGQAIDWSEE